LPISSPSHTSVNCWIDCETANTIVFAHRSVNGVERKVANVENSPDSPPAATSVSEGNAT